MAVKVAINGFGRIGRLALRLMANDPEFDVVAINDLTDAAMLAHLFKYDTAQGRFNGEIEVKVKATEGTTATVGDTNLKSSTSNNYLHIKTTTGYMGTELYGSD